MKAEICPHNHAIECSAPNGAGLSICSTCAWYGQENERRAQYLHSRAGAIESRRKKSIVRLKIRHSGKKTTYSLKTTRHSDNGQTVDNSTHSL